MSKDRAVAHEFEGEELESVFVGRRDGQARPTVILIPTVMGVTVMAAVFIVVANLVVDVVYAFLDPRVRYE